MKMKKILPLPLKCMWTHPNDKDGKFIRHKWVNDRVGLRQVFTCSKTSSAFDNYKHRPFNMKVANHSIFRYIDRTNSLTSKSEILGI